AGEVDKPQSDTKKDRRSHCIKGCEMRNNLVNAGFFASINKLS
ncbi:phage minor tail protein L, partial [Salmonella enterica subsp. enterica serovar Rissen]|nr:phage minor tail protein L [Salmonella enterica subsp. enterica serovar Rissen]